MTAVGELIIALLPGPLVNFGKETLGFADKPILLVMVVLAVLLLCGLAGRSEYRRRFAGAAVFAVVAVLGLVGVSAQPGAATDRVRADHRRTAARLPDPAHLDHQAAPAGGRAGRPTDAEAESAARRSFLGWTLVVGALAAAAAVGGQLLAGAATAVNIARDRLRLPPADRAGARPCRPGPTWASPT